MIEVRCCCNPNKLMGTLDVDVRRGARSVTLRQDDGELAGAAVNVTVPVRRQGGHLELAMGTAEPAVVSSGMSMDFWRSLKQFKEIA